MGLRMPKENAWVPVYQSTYNASEFLHTARGSSRAAEVEQLVVNVSASPRQKCRRVPSSTTNYNPWVFEVLNVYSSQQRA